MPTLGGIAGFAFCIVMARRLGAKMSMPVTETVRETVRAGAAIVIMSLSISLHPFLDVMLLSLLTSSKVVGWLGAARTIIGLLLAPASILATASFPELCRVAHSPQDLRHVLSASSRLLLTAGALSFCALFIFADTAVAMIYGRGHFDPAATVIKVSAPFFPLFFVNFLIGNTALAIGKNVQIAIAKSAAVAVSLMISWFLIGIFQSQIGNGAVGLMLSFCVTEVLMTIAYVIILPRGVLSGPIWTNLARAYVASVVVLLLANSIVPNVPLWVSGPFVILAFVAASLLTGLLVVDDLRVAATLIRSVLIKLPKFKI
jgi:O-antigen/teichoic acid export membrane protein